MGGTNLLTATPQTRSALRFVTRMLWLVALCVSCSPFWAIRGGGATAQEQCKAVHLGSYPLRLDSSMFILLAPRDGARSASGSMFFAGSPHNYVLPNRPAVEKHVIGVNCRLGWELAFSDRPNARGLGGIRTCCRIAGR